MRQTTAVTIGTGDGRQGRTRTRLLESPVAVVENLRHAQPYGPDPEAFCDVFQVCLPYAGLFVWRVAADDVVGDANQAIYVRAGEPYRMSAPVSGGYAELIITPALDVLGEIAGGSRLAEHPLFRRRACLITPALQSARTRFLHWATTARDIDPLQADEAVLRLLRATFHDRARRHEGGHSTRRLIRRAKEFMHAHLGDGIRLQDISRHAGASSAYLTDVFRRVEGLSLHRYLTRLRLGRALLQLPHTDDLTALALDSGFSSHSHFTAVFSRAFGVTPSTFRRTAGRGSRRTDARRRPRDGRFPRLAMSRHVSPGGEA
jgi:AraC family transcriptional regulator